MCEGEFKEKSPSPEKSDWVENHSVNDLNKNVNVSLFSTREDKPTTDESFSKNKRSFYFDSEFDLINKYYSFLY